MSRNNNNKKSTSKYRKFKVSPLIPVIAVVEVIVLIAISTYAWFVVSQEKEAKTGVITVNADSGLDIDFKNANYDDEINIWDYVEDDFSFEPVTSLDGRNVFVPTSGTFDKTNTNNMVFRDATINDINDKYLNVDFMLTNTTSSPRDVYLGNDSKFKVWNNSVDSNSRALRLAFYTNDGEHGKVDSSILANTNNENAILEDSENTFTVFFQNSGNWSDVYAYSWRRVGTKDYAVMEMPGSKMTRICGNIYSYTFSNPLVDTNNDNIPDTRTYTNILFNDGSGSYTAASTKTRDLTLVNGNIYYLSDSNNSSGRAYATKTIYFRKPSDWNKIYACVYNNGNNTLTGFPGDEMTDCGADIYSFTFPASSYPDVIFNDGSSNHQSNRVHVTDHINNSSLNPPLYYFTASSNGTPSVVQYKENTVYFFNSANYSNPYCKIATASGHTTEVPMTNLSAGVFFATIPSVYTTVVFEDGTEATQNTKYTQSQSIYDGYIYKPDTKTGSGWTVNYYSYSEYVGTAGQSPYAVISPGVSAGFQRAYTPVVDITPTNGTATQLVPAFASSIDNYIKGSGNPLFTIPAGGMKDLSMIIWLEGTDSDCTNDNYASTTLSKKEIELYLEFATTNVSRDSDNVKRITYRFYDKTREVWTSDRLTNTAGISIAPVMQLYDATDKRGYLMHAASTTNYGGKKKIDLWECEAPITLYNSNHDLYFRRVDPYNEDEVWNYWHPGVPVSDATSTVNGKQYISFTAFADGAPASEAEIGVNGNDQTLSAAETAGTPAMSCGGLWGTYETTLLTAVDGTNQFWLKNSDNNTTSSALTIQYTYKYPLSGESHKIEYKASGPFHSQMYYFVVPKALKEGITVGSTTKTASQLVASYKIHRFWHFNGSYAMNIYKRNSEMDFNNTCNVSLNSAMTGYYIWLSNTYNSSSVNQSWFGETLNFANICYKTEGNNTDMFGGTDIHYKAAFYNSGGTATEVYLYTNNGEFSLSNFNGYVMVAPLNRSKIQLRRCNNTYSTIYNYSPDWNVSNRNIVAYKYSGDTVDGDSNNSHTTYGWPKIPSYE